MTVKNNNSVHDVIHQAEMLQTKLVMEQQFKKNMELFKQINPEIYKTFSNYSAKKIWPIFDENGDINLANGRQNVNVYHKNPREHSKEVVENYLKHPHYLDLKLESGTGIVVDPEEDRSHVLNMHKLSGLVYSREREKIKLAQNPKSIRFMVMKGIGLGYQIEYLLQSVDIRYLCLVEPEKDIFFASMHILDYGKLFGHFNRKGYGLNIILEASRSICVRNLTLYMLSIGVHNIARFYEFDHLCSNAMNELAERTMEGLSESIKALGFFDDEQIGLAHSVHNFRQNYPLLTMHENSFDTPIFICGNGPSLDKAKDFLLANQEKALIMSGGSTLGSLSKMGIKPDFHVENERTLSILAWVESSSDREFRDDIKLLALNTVNPKVMEEFVDIGVALKPNDLGTCYFITKSESKKYRQLKFCNPTVSNTTVSMALHMGFKNIYLFGIDFGFSEDGEHHSKHSLYSKVGEEFYEGKADYEASSAQNFKIPGNFKYEVTTTRYFNNSKQTIELLLESFSEVKVFNTSDGAKIKGTVPMRLKEINLDSIKGDKKNIRDNIFNQSFSSEYPIDIFKEDVVKKAFNYVNIALNSCLELIEEDVKNIEQAMEKLDHISNLLVTLLQHEKLIYFLIKGSLLTATLFLSQSLHFYKEDVALEIYRKGLDIFKEFISEIKYKIEHHLLDHDHHIGNGVYLKED